MKKFALVGRDIQNSFSPAIHSYCFNSLCIDAKYDIIDINSPSQLIDVIKLLKDGELDGINITSPYKQSFLQYIDELNPRANTIGSINCIHNNHGKLIGNNTDWFGFAKSTENFTNYENVVIIGTGGAVHPLLYYFKSRHNLSVHIVGRDTSKLQSSYGDNVYFHNIEDVDLDLDNCMIINATPFNAKLDWKNIIPKLTSTPLYAFDLNYYLKVTEFLNYFNSDVKVQNGLHMLIYQALMSIDIWFNDKLSQSIHIEDLQKYINEQYYE